MKLRLVCVVIGFLSLVSLTVAQTSTQTASALPRLVRFGGTAKDLNGSPLTGVVGITFAFYSEKTGGAPLWLETQNATADSTGHYTVLLGSTKPEGLPAELFTSEQARWVGVQVSGQPELPRVLLVSAPYALKAGDAETIGGLPPSAFVLAAPPVSGPAAASSSADGAAESVSPATTSDVTTTGGTVNAIPLFSTATDIENSAITQTGSGATAKIGIGTTTPLVALDVKGSASIRGALTLPATGTATATSGKNSQPLSLTASAFNSTSSTALNQVFQWQAEPTSNDTGAPSGTLNLLFGEGATKPSETGLNIASNGQITFAAGQTFPGTGTGDGTITGVTAGTDLTGGGTAGNVTLNLNRSAINALYARLAANNTFTGTQTINNTTIVSGTNRAGVLQVTNKVTSGAGPAIVGTTDSQGDGVQGQSPNVGVHGTSAGTSATGAGHGKAGVWGDTGGAAGDGYYGVRGTADQNSGGGFFNNGAYPTVFATNAGSGNGVQGSTASPTGFGVVGTNATSFAGTVPVGGGVAGHLGAVSNTGSSENLFSGAGVWGDAGKGQSDTVGLLATADNETAALLFNNSSSNETLYVSNNGNGGGCLGCSVVRAGAGVDALVLVTSGGADGSGNCSINVRGDLACSGKVSAIVPAEGGARKVLLHAVQSPENWFEDFGSGTLAKGAASIKFEPAFVQTVNTRTEYHVFLTPKGDCKGLYVSNESATSFEVRELGGGTSDVAFDYRIVAKRNGYENARLEDVTEQYKKLEERHQLLRERAAQHK